VSEPKLHHYVPEFLLREFADETGRIYVRSRRNGCFCTSVRNAAAKTGLYSVPIDDGSERRDNSAEFTLGSVESAAAHALHRVIESGEVPPRGAAERQALGLFLGMQSLRTPEAAERHGFARAVLEQVGTERVSVEDMRAYLRDVHLGYEPSRQEVEAAVDVVNQQAEVGLATKADHHAQMFNLGVRALGPKFEAMQWSLERCRKPRFATCDRLPAVWRTESARDTYEGVGFGNAEEVWFPLDRTHLLVLRSEGAEEVRTVEPKRARFVNSHLARHCFNYVFHHPALRVQQHDFLMASRRPSIRFNSGPGYQMVRVAPSTSATWSTSGCRCAISPEAGYPTGLWSAPVVRNPPAIRVDHEAQRSFLGRSSSGR
jgi:hypothetical protein